MLVGYHPEKTPLALLPSHCLHGEKRQIDDNIIGYLPEKTPHRCRVTAFGVEGGGGGEKRQIVDIGYHPKKIPHRSRVTAFGGISRVEWAGGGRGAVR